MASEDEELAALALDHAELVLLTRFGRSGQPFSTMQGNYGAYRADLLCGRGLVRRTVERDGYYEYELTELGHRLWRPALELLQALNALAMPL